MRKIAWFGLLLTVLCGGCMLMSRNNPTKEDNKELAALQQQYVLEYRQLHPEAATAGDSASTGGGYAVISDGRRDTLRSFFLRYRAYINHYERDKLNNKDQAAFDSLRGSIDSCLTILPEKNGER